MKPTKNRIFCPSCNRTKMLFDNAKSARLFISYNHDDILKAEGYAPVRAYYCTYCAGWHVTSKEFPDDRPERRVKFRRKPSPVIVNQSAEERDTSGKRSEVLNRKMREVIETIKDHRQMMETIALDLNTLPVLDRARDYVTYNIGRLAQKAHRMNTENKAQLGLLVAWWREAEQTYKVNTRLVRLLKCCQDNIAIGQMGLERCDFESFAEAFVKAKQMLEAAISMPGMMAEKHQCMNELESLADSLLVMRQSA